MESETFAPARDLVKCCNCGCDCSLVTGSSGSWIRSVKRKYEEFEEGNKFFIPGFDLFSNARVQVENECLALRETVSSQQQAIQDLHAELEEERNASSSAANEAMSMILRLQREKAEIQMEARQFKRFAEEKMAHDQQELGALEDLLYKREQAIQSLTCEVQAYKHRMLSYGLTEAEADGEKGCFSRNTSMVDIDAQFDLPAFDYPPLRCNLNENPGTLEGDIVVADIEKYEAGEPPHCRELKNLEHRISQMERNPSYNQLDGDFSGGKNVLEKVIVGHSPRWPRHYRKLSTDSSGSFMGMAKESNPEFTVESPKFNGSSRRMEHVSQTEDTSHLKRMDNASEIGDDTSDRVYTIDSVYNGVSYNGVTEGKSGVGVGDDYVVTPRDSLTREAGSFFFWAIFLYE
ncbi:myosin-binding protein 7-like [Carica papaya]|uniref:myosin-binding protein 7-like n=1 Tax=Carica papaya TaxID=3649 RepID=UPI000B8C7FC2|nr:myosin-binding protein 7-like [Carica papaya]